MTQYTPLEIDEKMGGSFRHQRDSVSRMIDGTSFDPLGRPPISILSRGTVMAPVVATGLMKPWRATLAAAISLGPGSGETTGVHVADPQMFAAGDVIGYVPLATPLAAATEIGTVSTIAGSILTLGTYVAHALADGDIIVVMENDQASDAGILGQNVSLYTNQLNSAPGQAPLTVTTDGAVVYQGEIDEAQVIVGTAFPGSILVARVKAMLPLIYIVPPVPGVA